MIKSTSAKSRLTLSCGVAALTAALALGAPALAQDSTVGEVVVTAQKRSENLQDVPLSVAALDGERLQSIFAGGDDDLPHGGVLRQGRSPEGQDGGQGRHATGERQAATGRHRLVHEKSSSFPPQAPTGRKSCFPDLNQEPDQR